MSDDNPDWTQRVDVPLKFTVMSDTPGGYGNAGQGLVVNDTETGLGYSKGKVDGHSARHEDGGVDPISNLGGNVVFPDRSYFRVYTSDHFFISADVAAKLPLDTAIFDNRNDFDINNYKFIVPQDGFYWFGTHILFTGGIDNDRIDVWLENKNGVQLVQAIERTESVTYITIVLNAGLYLSKDQEIFVYVINHESDDKIYSGKRYTFFSGCLIA